MSLKAFFEEIDQNVTAVLDSSFEVEIVETAYVPTFDDSSITYDNLDKGIKKCKRLESCVLYVDIRGSAQISAQRRPKTLAKTYSTFVRSMIACARFYGGHVRNIIGDRVMVVFDKKDCFKVAVDTAVLMNSVNEHILNHRIKAFDFKCGIGIDYGQMLITKSGATRHGSEKEFYRSLVWLGKPANVASRLTDVANKERSWSINGIKQGNYYRHLEEWLWIDKTYSEFIDDLEVTHTPELRHKDQHFSSFFKTTLGPYSTTPPPILLTQAVYDGLENDHPEDVYFSKNLLKKRSVKVRDYTGTVFGGDIIFPIVKDI